MKELQYYERQFREYLYENYPYIGKPLNVTVKEIQSGKYHISAGMVYKYLLDEEDTVKISKYKDGIVEVTRDAVVMSFLLDDNLELIFEKTVTGEEKKIIEKMIYLDDNAKVKIGSDLVYYEVKPKGRLIWDGENFFSADKESREMKDIMTNYIRKFDTSKLNYVADFNFDKKIVRIIKDIEGYDLKEAVEDFDTSEYEKIVESFYK